MELFKAARQWATRPDDEAFWTVEEMRNACAHYQALACEVPEVAIGSLKTEPLESGDLAIVGRTGLQATMSHFAFGQVARLSGAPAGYLRELPPTLASQCVNVGLERRAKDIGQMMFHQANGSAQSVMVLRAINGPGYSRLWNADVIDMVMNKLGPEWKLPPGRPVNGRRTRAATEADVLRNASHKSLGVKVGDKISPAGAYASDKDMFLFMVDDGRRVSVPGSPEGLCKGFMLWNSEVGDLSVGGMAFYFDAVCGNHIVWGASGVTEFRFRHTGKSLDSKTTRAFELEVRRYSDRSVSEEEATIERAQRMRIADTKDEVIALLAGKTDISKTDLTTSYEVADRTDRYGDPKTVWGMVNGITEVSQRTKYTDRRVKMDRAAGKVMQIAF